MRQEQGKRGNRWLAPNCTHDHNVHIFLCDPLRLLRGLCALDLTTTMVKEHQQRLSLLNGKLYWFQRPHIAQVINGPDLKCMNAFRGELYWLRVENLRLLV